MIKAAMINFGYAEDSQLAWFSFSTNEKFKTARSVVVSLAEYFKNKFYGKVGNPGVQSACCVKSKDNGNQFCGTCGHRILDNITFDGEAFEDYLKNTISATCDWFGYEDYDTAVWSPDSGMEGVLKLKTSEILFIYQAEQVFSLALGYNPYPDKKTFDGLFTPKSTVVSFW